MAEKNKLKKTNIVLIGMPGAGKSTIGVLLAKYSARAFVDTDLLIQVQQGQALQQTIETKGFMELRKIEESILLSLNCDYHVVATGGSAIYSSTAMKHLKKNAVAIFLNVELDELIKRVSDFDNRGIARRPDQNFSDLFLERYPLYEKHADIIIDATYKTQEESTREICMRINP